MGFSRRVGALLFAAALVACGGGAKKGTTTPAGKAGAGAGASGGAGAGGQSMNDTGTPDASGVPGSSAGAADGGGGAAGAGSAAGGGAFGAPTPGSADVAIVFPNQDPDPGQAKSQVDQHLTVARQALLAPTPDPDTALREAREALKIDASSLDAAAYVALAYYTKKQYDTAELILDDLFKRDAAKRHAGVYYVYGLVYDHTNRPDQATLAFKRATELNPNFASAWVDLGMHQLINKQYGDAQATFEKVTGQLGRNDAVALTSLGSAYRGRSGDYPPGSGDRNGLIQQAEATYKRALQTNANYGPAYYNLGLLYLDSDPFPSGGGKLDTLLRLNAAKGFFDQYKNMPGVDMKLYDERVKDVSKAVKREEKLRKKSGKSGGG